MFKILFYTVCEMNESGYIGRWFQKGAHFCRAFTWWGGGGGGKGHWRLKTGYILIYSIQKGVFTWGGGGGG